MLELVGKGEGVVRLKSLACLFPDTVLVVWDIITRSLPPNIFLLAEFLRVNKDLHSLIEYRVRFRQIENIKPDFLILRSILHSEKEPLSMSRSINIILEE